MARPTTYTDEIAKKIVEQTATSAKSLKTICAELDVPVRTVLDWLCDKEEFSQMYARGKQEQADFLAEEMLEIADDSSDDTKVIYKEGRRVEVENSEWVNRSKLRVETRKWIAAKLKPRKYGDKLEIEGQMNHGVSNELLKDIAERIKA